MFKTTTPVLALALLLPGAAMADVMLERITSPGFVMEAYAATTGCTLDDNGQLATHYQLGQLTSHRVQQVQLSVPAIKAAINEAATGAIQSEIFPVDAGTVIYRAYKQRTDGTYRTVLLWEENGGVGSKKTNQSPAAMTLKNFIDLNCTGVIQF